LRQVVTLFHLLRILDKLEEPTPEWERPVHGIAQNLLVLMIE
jgi:hypothetical protein